MNSKRTDLPDGDAPPRGGSVALDPTWLEPFVRQVVETTIVAVSAPGATVASPTTQQGPAPSTAAANLDQLLTGLRELLDASARPPAVEKLAVDLDEAAQLVSCSVKTLKRMVAAGEVPGVIRIRRRILISVAALKEWVAKGCPPVRTSRPRVASGGASR